MVTRWIRRIAISAAMALAALLGLAQDVIGLAPREAVPTIKDLALDPRLLLLVVAFLISALLGSAGRWGQGRRR